MTRLTLAVLVLVIVFVPAHKHRRVASDVLFDAAEQFSETQGFFGWSYLDSSGRPMSYDALMNVWRGSEQFVTIAARGTHPGTNVDAILRWTAVRSGVAHVRGRVADADVSGDGDGVDVSIRHGQETIWRKTINEGDTTGFELDVAVEVERGDTLDFVTFKRGHNGNDSTLLQPRISLQPGRNDPPDVALTQPVSSVNVAEWEPLELRADAVDVNGTIDAVEFWWNGQMIGASREYPYSFHVSGLPAGDHYFLARAFDNEGAASVSSMVAIAVGGQNSLADNGRITVEPGSRFLTRNGAPFFWFGDTAWRLFTRYTPQDVVEYFDSRRALGVNVVQAVAVWHGAPGPGVPAGEPNRYTERPFINDDFGTPNDRFFDNVDFVIEEARKRGIVIGFLPLWGQEYVWRYQTLRPAGAFEYGRYLGRRYADRTNVIWILGGDTEISAYADVYKALAAGIREFDRSSLMTYHPGTTSTGTGSTTDPRFNPFGIDQPELQINMFQSWRWRSQIIPRLREAYNSSPVKPLIQSEPAYEGADDYPGLPFITPAIARQQTWWSFMLGAGHTYGHHLIWQMGTDWQKALTAQGMQQSAAAASFMRSREWWRYQPNTSPLETATATTFPPLGLLKDDGTSFLLYTAVPLAFTIDTSRLAGDNLTATWYNPTSGVPLKSMSLTARAIAFFSTPPGWEDALLVIENVAR